jgi:hypothetical protein
MNRGDGMTAFKTAMNNYQSFLQTNTKTVNSLRKGFNFLKCRLSMFYAQCDNKGSMYKLAVKAIDDVNSACAGGHLHSHGIYFYSATVSIL